MLLNIWIAKSCAMKATNSKYINMQLVSNEDIPFQDPLFKNKASCKLCTKIGPDVNLNGSVPTTNVPSGGQPYYVCTVTCCDSVNCTKPSTTSLLGKSIITKAIDSYSYNGLEYSAKTSPKVLNSMANNVDSMYQSCPICVKSQLTKPKLMLITDSVRDKDCSKDQVSPDINSIPIKTSDISGKSTASKSPILKSESPCISCSSPVLKTLREDSIRRSPRLQIYLSNDKSRVQSPELSSSPPLLGNSSFTDYTETRSTPICTSVNSTNPDDLSSHFKFNVDSKASLYNSDYQFYFNNAESHGFFRKAVPALPIAVAILFCIFNLILPGSGTLLASFTVIFGSQTEYGPGYGCRAFFICFLSAILQFITAIFVFGWVWSIMWGIVFIKNSLRYGERRDIHTMSLC